MAKLIETDLDADDVEKAKLSARQRRNVRTQNAIDDELRAGTRRMIVGSNLKVTRGPNRQGTGPKKPPAERLTELRNKRTRRFMYGSRDRSTRTGADQHEAHAGMRAARANVRRFMGVRKSLDELDTAIEKAKGLMPRGGSSKMARRFSADALLRSGGRGGGGAHGWTHNARAYLGERKKGGGWRTWNADGSAKNRRTGVYKSAPVVHFTIDRTHVAKSGDITGRYAAGFASVIEKDGKRVTDTQDDVIFWDDLAETAHAYIKEARVAKVMHGGDPVGEVVESVLIDDDFAKALGLTDPRRGWFIKMDIADPVAREKNRNGKFGGFSIGGTGRRVDLTD